MSRFRAGIRYVQASTCLAGFGIVFRNLAPYDCVFDPQHPELLLYEPQKNGRMRLTAVELLVLAIPRDATHSGPPTYAGYEFEDRRAPGSPGPMRCRVWVWGHNPNGLTTPFNPTVPCEFAP